MLNKSIALVAVFGNNIEIFLNESKQLPKWRYLVEKKFKIFQKQKFFSIGQIDGSKSCFVLLSAVELVGVTIWWVHVKAHEMRMWNLVLGLSLAQILLEKINKMIRMLCPGRFSLVESVLYLVSLLRYLIEVIYWGPMKTVRVITYLCTERILDSRPFMYIKVFFLYSMAK